MFHNQSEMKALSHQKGRGDSLSSNSTQLLFLAPRTQRDQKLHPVSCPALTITHVSQCNFLGGGAEESGGSSTCEERRKHLYGFDLCAQVAIV